MVRVRCCRLGGRSGLRPPIRSRTMAEEEAPKIIVDSDWKDEAQREKEELDREVREAMGGPGELPPPSILELVEMTVMQASIGLQGYQDPASGRVIPPNL